MQRKKLKVAFAWQTLTSENLGVAALAQSQIALAREAAAACGLEMTAMEFCSSGPHHALAEKLGCELADPLSVRKILFGKSKYLAQLRECDLVLDIGEGDSFSDIYGGKRFFFLSFSKFLALWLKKPLVLSPQTIGPFSASWVKVLAKALMRRAKKVFARDDLSMQILREMGIKENAQDVIDVAFSLPFERQKFEPADVVRVGINVSGLLMNGGYTRNNQFGLTVDYPAHIHGIIKGFLAMDGVEVHLVGHVLADTLAVEDDYAENLRLKEQYGQLIVAPRFSSPSDAKSYIAGLDFFTGARMHACIAAFSSGVPVVPAAYSRKFNGLFGVLGYKHIADLKADTTEQAIQNVMRGFENRDALRVEVTRGNDIAQSKLEGYRLFLRGFFAQIAGDVRQ